MVALLIIPHFNAESSGPEFVALSGQSEDSVRNQGARVFRARFSLKSSRSGGT